MLSKIKSPFLIKLLEEKLFSFVDYFFAYSLLKNSENEELFLALSYLFKSARLGHLCVKVENTIAPSPYLLFKQEAEEGIIIDAQIEKMIAKGFSFFPEKIVQNISSSELSSKPICFYKNSYYLQRNFYFESQIVNQIEKINKCSPSKFDLKILEEEVERLLQANEILPAQAKAIKLIINNTLSFIFGGPGTGKTHTAVLLIRLLAKVINKNFRILIGSITGKAAHHLFAKMNVASPNIKIEALTLHSLLKIGSKKKPFLDADLIIIDEASMIDAKILCSLFQTVNPFSRLVLIGDPNQLPPIESGNLFASFSSSKFEKLSCTLTQALRFDNPVIHNLAEAIKIGDATKTTDIIKESNLMLCSSKKMEENKFLKEKILEEARKNFLDASFSNDVEKSFEAFFNFRILSSLRFGFLGSLHLNKMIFDHLQTFYRNGTFIIPILILKNDYKMGLFNGTSGILIKKYYKGSFKEEACFLDSSNKMKVIPSYLLPSYEYGYCLSVHKSQGSEFNNVLFILPEKGAFFGRELLYTAVTRAKKKIEILSNIETIEKMVASNISLQTNLLERI